MAGACSFRGSSKLISEEDLAVKIKIRKHAVDRLEMEIYRRRKIINTLNGEIDELTIMLRGKKS